MGIFSNLARLVALFAFLWCASIGAEAADELYQGRAVVTGTGEVNRAIGLAQTFTDVLVKVSGDARLIDDPRVAALAREVNGYVAGFTYLDLYAGRSLHDEQGSYDRPHYLTVDFKPDKIDGVLRSLGRKPWAGPRPHFVVFLAVRKAASAFVLAAGHDRIPYMNQSLETAAKRVGLTVTVPEQPALDRAGLTFETLSSASLSDLTAAARSSGGDTPIAGSPVWSDAAHGWIATWRVPLNGKAVEWEVSGVGFDEAFRSGMRGTAQAFSGNGLPE
jgi:hypothetical protein